jgi:hypothetical protein
MVSVHDKTWEVLKSCLWFDSNLRDIKKLGEGTFGEAFKGGGNVFKIVPMDGTFLVNGEHQKVDNVECTCMAGLCFESENILRLSTSQGSNRIENNVVNL